MQSLVEICPVVIEKILLSLQYMGFYTIFFASICPLWKGHSPLCDPPPLNSLHRRMVCVKFGGNWLNGTKEVLFWRPFTSHMHIRNAFVVRVKYILFNTIICWLPWYAAKIYKHKFPKDFKGGGGVTRYWPRPKEYKIPSYRSHEGRDCEKEGNVVRLTSPSRPQTFTPLHSRALIRDHCRVPLVLKTTD